MLFSLSQVILGDLITKRDWLFRLCSFDTSIRDSINLEMKHDLTKLGSATEVIEDLTKIIDELKEYEKSIK